MGSAARARPEAPAANTSSPSAHPLNLLLIWSGLTPAINCQSCSLAPGYPALFGRGGSRVINQVVTNEGSVQTRGKVPGPGLGTAGGFQRKAGSGTSGIWAGFGNFFPALAVLRSRCWRALAAPGAVAWRDTAPVSPLAPAACPRLPAPCHRGRAPREPGLELQLAALIPLQVPRDFGRAGSRFSHFFFPPRIFPCAPWLLCKPGKSSWGEGQGMSPVLWHRHHPQRTLKRSSTLPQTTLNPFQRSRASVSHLRRLLEARGSGRWALFLGFREVRVSLCLSVFVFPRRGKK